PRINAGGRIGNAALGAELLTTDDPHRAMTIAAELDRLNAERQDIERLALEEAEARALHQVEAEQPVIVVAGEDWHPGVLGLVAARLKERHDRPAFALAPNMEGDFTGSGRSVPGVDLGRAVRRLVDEGFLVKGGGHAMAAGVTLKAGGLDDFRGALAGLLGDAVGAAREASRLRLDGVMTATAASTAAVKALLAAGPFGAAFPEPLIAFPGHRLADIATVGAGGHIRVTLLDGGGGRLKAIAFRAAGGPLGPALMEARDGRPRHVVGSLSLDHWGGNPKPQLRIVDVALP
ncbi:MAG: single-stranded-DNA-specific exonuclease RecJ, partial [Hyphomicrobiaceae bacterium]|nr:single-stranded-DNA-specific exonuclease RecJ [Hyphomicrobiaceae bacterium]